MMTRLLFAGLIVTLTAACGIADVRPESIVVGHSPADEEKGRALVAEMARAHKMAGLCEQQTAEAIVTDVWNGLFSAIVPWPRDVTRVHMRWGTCSDNARATFLDGGRRRLSGFGVQNWVTYEHNAQGELTWTENANARFMVPTVVYFFELPGRIGDAEIIAYAGEQERDGRIYDTVFATWKGTEPQKDVDQYLLWIDRETKFLKYVAYTVRESGESTQGFGTYGDVVDHGTYTSFESLEVHLSDGGMWAHTMDVRSYRAGPEVVATEVFLPDPSKARTKEKPADEPNQAVADQAEQKPAPDDSVPAPPKEDSAAGSKVSG